MVEALVENPYVGYASDDENVPEIEIIVDEYDG